MAKSLDDSNDSQFFITEGPQRHLDSQHTVFGLLTTGESVREAISGTPVTSSAPDTPVVINSFSVFTDIENGVLMLSAPEGVTGSATITVTVSDPDGNESQQTFDVTIQADANNNQPFLADIPSVRTLVDTPTELQLTRIDLEGNTARMTTTSSFSTALAETRNHLAESHSTLAQKLRSRETASSLPLERLLLSSIRRRSVLLERALFQSTAR